MVPELIAFIATARRKDVGMVLGRSMGTLLLAIYVAYIADALLQ